VSLTNPDQASSTPSLSPTSGGTTVPSQALLPPGLPTRILPGVGGVSQNASLPGYSMISVMFDSALNWPFVATTSVSASQIFAWFPTLLSTGAGISLDQVQTLALQVWIPDTYHGPSDVAQLQTLWLGFIPSDSVNTLASQIKVKASPFYVLDGDPYVQLAAHVDPSFAIDTISNTSNSGGQSSSSGGPNTSSSSSGSKSREDAIIGVVSAVGGITLLILAFLIYRAVQKRREMAHRRLSDVPQQGYTGEAPPNRDFDQDSVGGQRRRSFYFAEDSLRGLPEMRRPDEHEQQALFRTSPESVHPVNRRTILPSAISAPVMRENSLNF